MANYYTYSLLGTTDPPCLPDFKLLYCNKIMDNVELTIYEEKPNVDIVTNIRLPRYFVILEDGTTYDMFFVKIRVKDNRRKFELLDTKEMWDAVARIARTLVNKRRYEQRMANDMSAVWNQNIM